MTYDFDRLIDRRRTDSQKWQTYGPDVLPLWIADMDFQSPEPVIRALRERVEHGVFGYLTFEQPEFHQLFADRLLKHYGWRVSPDRSEEHTSELQSRPHLVCRLLLEKKKKEFMN